MTTANSPSGARLRRAIRRLKDHEIGILSARYGLLEPGIPKTLDEIGEEFSLTPERIRQIEEQALSKMRHPAFGLREVGLL